MKKSKTAIKIKDLISPYCGSHVEGEKLLKYLTSHWNSSDKITINFAGVRMASSSFFNAGIGDLILKYPIDDIKSKLHFVYLSQRDRFLLNKSIRAAIKQHGSDPQGDELAISSH